MPFFWKPRKRNWNLIFKRKGRVFFEPLPEEIAFAELLKKRNLTRVLDLGCGSGRHLVYLKQQGFDVWGLDNAPAGLRLSKEWLEKGHIEAPLVLASVYSPFPFPDDTFDAILSTRVIHHAYHEQAIGAVMEMKRVLRKGGAVLLVVPGSSKRRGRSKMVAERTYIQTTGREKGIPHYLFTPEELKELFGDFSKCEVEVKENHLNVLTAIK